MSQKGLRFDYRIWALAMGYFAFYIPYSALTKALSNGILPGMEGRVAGFELLPTTIIGTVLTMPVIITLLGWWKYTDHAKVLGLSLPVPSPGSVVSGLAFAVVIATTTLAYTFEGISIVFALLLMRGGVLILAPIVDNLSHKQVHWFSWGALALSFLALTVALSDVGSYRLSVAAMINLALYLTGYFFRLRLITRSGKSEFEHTKYRYFVEEQMVAMPMLIAVPAVVAWVGTGTIAEQLRRGFTTFLFSNLAQPALLIGAVYAALGTFGTLIYLNRRENCFSIPVNRCSSLLAGLVAAYALMITLGQPAPRPSQLVSAAVIVAAIFLLSARTLASPTSVERLVLFVCNGNTARSPMAEAICNSEVDELLGRNGVNTLRFVSAGITIKLGAAMKPEAVAALAAFGVAPGRHTAKGVTADMIERAHVIFCFTEEQQATLLSRHPEAADKVRRLNPHADIPEPRVGDAVHFEQVAGAIRAQIRMVLADPTIVGAAG